jgi:hypothetical protein
VKRVRCVGSDVSEHVVPRGRQPRYGQGSSHVPVVKPGAMLGVMESESRWPGVFVGRVRGIWSVEASCLVRRIRWGVHSACGSPTVGGRGRWGAYSKHQVAGKQDGVGWETG